MGLAGAVMDFPISVKVVKAKTTTMSEWDTKKLEEM